MAQTFRPYQSQGIGLNQLNLPQGTEAQESSRTMQVLSQGLNRMSDFALKQANIQAQEEGAKWGVENAPTLASIKKTQKDGKDTNDLFEFGNTTFGRYARQSALKTLENEVLLTATNDINDLVFQAIQNNTAPSVLENQLNATIMGMTDAIAPSAPELASLLKARLGLQTAGEFDRYRTAHAKGSVGNVTAGQKQRANNFLNSLPNLLTSILKTKGELSGEELTNQIALLKADGLKEFVLAGFTKGSLQTKLNEMDEGVKDWFVTQFSTELFERDISTSSDFSAPTVLIQNLRNGDYQGDDPEAKRIMEVLKFAEKNPKKMKGIRLPTYADLEEAVAKDFDRRMTVERSTTNLAIKRKEQNREAIKTKWVNLLDTDDVFDEDKIKKANKLISDMDALGIYSEEVEAMREALAPLSAGEFSFPPQSDTETKFKIEQKIADFQVTYFDLVNARRALKYEDYRNFVTAVEANIDERVQSARDKIVERVGLDPDILKQGLALLTPDQQAQKRQFNIVYNELKEQWDTARIEGEAFYPKKAVLKIIADTLGPIKEIERKENVRVGIFTIDNIIKELKEKGVDTEALRGKTDEETLQIWITLFESWAEFDDFKKIPQDYYQNSLTFQDWWERDAWKSTINSKLLTFKKGLPDGQ